MKVIILAGGFGTRLSEYTKLVPKPMVKVNSYPLLIHIMQIYIKHNIKDFISILRQRFVSCHSICFNEFLVATINTSYNTLFFHCISIYVMLQYYIYIQFCTFLWG